MKRILIASSLLLLQSCGGEEGLGPAGNVKDFKSFTAVMSAFGEMNTFLGTDPTDANELMPTNVPTFGFLAPDYSSCSSFTIGSSETDDHYKLVYNCSGLPDSGAAVDYKGYIEQDINDRNELDLGYYVTYDLKQYRKNSNGTYIDSTFKGLQSFTKKSKTYERVYEYLYAVEGDWEPVPVDWQVQRQVKVTYTPDDMNDMMKKGKISFEGAFGMSGLVGPDGNGVAIPYLKFGLSFQSKNLTYDDTCTSGSLDGTIIYIDGSNNKIEVVYDCNQVGNKIYLNGVEQQNFFNP